MYHPYLWSVDKRGVVVEFASDPPPEIVTALETNKFRWYWEDNEWRRRRWKGMDTFFEWLRKQYET